MAIALWGTSLNRQQRAGNMEVKIRGHFFRIKSAEIGLLLACADDGKFIKLDQPYLNKVS